MKTKLMFAIGILMLIAMMASSGAIAGTAVSDNFESYTAGINLGGQGDWTDWIGSDETVSTTAIPGTKSLVVGTDTCVVKPVSFFDVSIFSFSVKVTEGSGCQVYFLRAGSPTGLAWFQVKPSGVNYNDSGIAGTELQTHTNITGGPLTVGHIYKTTITMDFVFRKTTVSVYDVADPGTVWTHQSSLAFAGDLTAMNLGSIGLANGWGAGTTGTTTYDDISLTEGPPSIPPGPSSDPIIHYTFSDGAGSIVTDSSGNLYDGGIVGNPDWGTDLLNFNAGQYVNTTTETAMGITNDMSFISWVNFDPTSFPDGSTNFHLFNDMVFGTSGQSFRINGDNGLLVYVACGYYIPLKDGYHYDYIMNSTPLVPGSKYMLGLTRSGTTVSIYINGELSASGNIPFYDYYGDTFKIGSDSQSFKGQMSDVKIYNTALTGAQILAQYADVANVPKDGPVAHYKFKNGAGSIVTDVTGNGHNGVISGTPTWGVNKLTFINQNGSVACGSESSLGISNDMTYAGLVKWEKTSPVIDTNYTLFSSSVDNDTGQDFRIDGDGRLTYLSWLAGSGVGLQGIPGMVAGNTYHIGFVRSGTTVKMYVNGVIRTDYSLGNASVDMYDRNTSQFRLANGYFCGDMMDVQIYNRALTDANIQYLYDNPGLDVANVPVTGVSLNRSTLSVASGGTATLVATVLPIGASNEAVTWSTDNAAVATVDSNGKVTGIGTVGQTCNIKATSVDGGFIATCAITINAGGPVLHYVFNEGTGSIVKDISGNGNNGTISGGAIWGVNKLTFPNQAGSVACGTESDLGIETDMTYTGSVNWIIVDPWSDTNYTLFDSSSGNSGQTLRFEDAGRFTYLAWGGDKWYQGIYGVMPGTYHIGFVRSGTTVKIYINGVYRTDIGLGEPTGEVSMYPRNSEQFRLSRNAFCGDMMDVQVYNRALSDANITYLYNNPGYDVLGNHYVPPVMGTITGKVNLQDFSGDISSIPVVVEVGVDVYTLALDTAGNFSIVDVINGTYDVRIKASHWLAKLVPGVVVFGDINIGTVVQINGDVVDSNEVDFDDINATRTAYGSFPGDDNWNERADVDGSGEVDFTDINIVRSKYGEIGD